VSGLVASGKRAKDTKALGRRPDPSTLSGVERSAQEVRHDQVDFGDWQELSRLRFENHAWHRCVDAVLQAVNQPGATPASIAEAVQRSVDTLNERLMQLHRRAATLRRQ
jgi:hypothetical protein